MNHCHRAPRSGNKREDKCTSIAIRHCGGWWVDDDDRVRAGYLRYILVCWWLDLEWVVMGEFLICDCAKLTPLKWTGWLMVVLFIPNRIGGSVNWQKYDFLIWWPPEGSCDEEFLRNTHVIACLRIVRPLAVHIWITCNWIPNTARCVHLNRWVGRRRELLKKPFAICAIHQPS